MGVEVAIGSAAAISKVAISNGYCFLKSNKTPNTWSDNLIESSRIIQMYAAWARAEEK